MNEAFLQYIWQYALFQPDQLKDTAGRSLLIIHPGRLNKDEGPDFSNARIRIGGVEWIGNIEIHIRSSDWKRHHHEHHPLYQNIILHVVWENEELPSWGNFSTLEIRPFVRQEILEKYGKLFSSHSPILCASMLHQVPDFRIKDWFGSLLIQRWQQKTKDWQRLFVSLEYNWRSLLYIKLAENFGFKVNAQPMRLLAQSVPLSIVEKLTDDPRMIAALYFGMSGLLPQDHDHPYVQRLTQDYLFLSRRFDLQSLSLPWKFMRLRPGNFPTVRIAQFAALMGTYHTFSGRVFSVHNTREAYALFDLKTDEFWDNHFHFQKESRQNEKKTLGKDSIQNIMINTIAPFLFFYGRTMEDESLKDKALSLIENVSAERNYIIRMWKQGGLHPGSAAESQALLQLFNEYCLAKRCLECRIGNYILSAQNE